MKAIGRKLLSGYLKAKLHVLDAGYEEDLVWAAGLAHVQPDELYVLREAAWVIINSGFRYQVARKLWPAITAAFCDWDLEVIDESCVDKALATLNHRGKVGAIHALAVLIRSEGITKILADAADPPQLCRLPWIGKTTCWHLAKVLGVDCIKPDVHLKRAARAAGYDEPLAFCQGIQVALGEPFERLTVIDSVLWRYGEQQRVRQWPTWNQLWIV